MRGPRDERTRAREGGTTLRSGLQGIAYVIAMAVLVVAVGFVLAVVVSWVY